MPEFARSAMCLLEGIFDGQVVNIMVIFAAMGCRLANLRRQAEEQHLPCSGRYADAEQLSTEAASGDRRMSKANCRTANHASIAPNARFDFPLVRNPPVAFPFSRGMNG